MAGEIQKKEPDALPARARLGDADIATADEMRDILKGVVARSVERHDRAMQAHEVFLDMVSNSGDPDAMNVLKMQMLDALKVADSADNTVISAVKVMVQGRTKQPAGGGGGGGEKGINISGSQVLIGSARAMNEAAKRNAKAVEERKGE